MNHHKSRRGMLLLSRKFWNREITLTNRSLSATPTKKSLEASSSDDSDEEMEWSQVTRKKEREDDAEDLAEELMVNNDSRDNDTNDFTESSSSSEPKLLFDQLDAYGDVESDEFEEEKDYDDQRTIEQKRLRNKYIKLKREIRQEYSTKKGYLEGQNLDTRKVESTKKFSTIWKTIIDKYSEYNEDDQGDIVNLDNFSIEDNKGHIENLIERSWENIWIKTKDDDQPKRYEIVSEPNFDPFEDPINLINLKSNKTLSPCKKSPVKSSRLSSPTRSRMSTPKKPNSTRSPVSLLKEQNIPKSTQPSPVKAFQPSPLRISKSSPLKPLPPTKVRELLIPRVTPRDTVDSDPISLLRPSSSVKKIFPESKSRSPTGILGLLGSSPTKKRPQMCETNDPIVLLTPRRVMTPKRVMTPPDQPVFTQRRNTPPPKPVFEPLLNKMNHKNEIELKKSNPAPSSKAFRSFPIFQELSGIKKIVNEIEQRRAEDQNQTIISGLSKERISVIEVSDSEDEQK